MEGGTITIKKEDGTVIIKIEEVTTIEVTIMEEATTKESSYASLVVGQITLREIVRSSKMKKMTRIM